MSVKWQRLPSLVGCETMHSTKTLLPILLLIALTPSIAKAQSGSTILPTGNQGKIIRHIETDLEWFAAPDRPMTFNEAAAWAAGLSVDGGGWRLPTLKELKALNVVGHDFGNLMPLFKNTGYWLWAQDPGGSAEKWVYRFSYGGEGWHGEAPFDGGRAVAVRKRKPR